MQVLINKLKGRNDNTIIIVVDKNNRFILEYCLLNEVTVSEYKSCVNSGKCPQPNLNEKYCNWDKAKRANHPMNCVNWDMANNYCRAYGKFLPSEQQWMLAAGAKHKNVFPWGNEKVSSLKLNFCEQNCEYSWKNYDFNDRFRTTSPVCYYPIGNSEEGLCDMAGNVWEWTSDWYKEDDQKNKLRLIRGGSWSSTINHIELSYNTGADPEQMNNSIGFRCITY